MTAAPAQPTPPVDSLEVRWIVPGQLGQAVCDWFTRFPGLKEEREDVYLLRPRLAGLSVKLRDASTLDVKSYLGSPGVLALPGWGQGRLESWRKWSFPYGATPFADPGPGGWVTVSKSRRSAWFPLPASDNPAPVRPPPGTGCMAELTRIEVGGERWWSVGLEATGSTGLLPAAVRHAAGLLFAGPLPAWAGFRLDNSLSYVQWVHLRFGVEPWDPPEGSAAAR